MLAQAQAKIAELQNKLTLTQVSQNTENPIEVKIRELQNQILAIPTGFSGTTSAARREADNLINVRLNLQSQIDKLTAQLKEPLNISPNTLNQLGEPIQKNLNSILLIGGLVVGAILLKN